MQNRRKGGSSAGVNDFRRGPNADGSFETKAFTSGSLPRVRWNAWPAFIGNWGDRRESRVARRNGRQPDLLRAGCALGEPGKVLIIDHADLVDGGVSDR